MAALRVVIAVLAILATTALATDKLLTSAGASCNDSFKQIMADNYADDSNCQNLIKAALTTAPTNVAQCPGGVRADPGTPVHKCLTKSQQTKDAWVSFIQRCEVLNVNERTGAGEAEAAADAKPSCFPRFDSLQAFKDYINSAGTASAAASAAVLAMSAKGAAVLTAAAVGVAVLL